MRSRHVAKAGNLPRNAEAGASLDTQRELLALVASNARPFGFRDEPELIHNLSESLLEPNFVEHDIWFLNHQARVYHDQSSPSRSPNYRRQLDLIGELFTMVSEPLRTRLSWGGPRQKSKGTP